MEVDAIIGDAAYSGKENLQLAKEQNIDIIAKLNSYITQGFRKDEDKFDYNKDAGMLVCPAGHLAIRKDQMAFQETEHYRSKSKERYKIEAKNSELKNVHGYGRADSYGVQSSP